MDTIWILVLLSILSVSGLFTLWQTRTYRHGKNQDWRREILDARILEARRLDEEAIREYDAREGNQRKAA